MSLNVPANELGMLLREWRGRRGKSQFDLSLDTGISQRHISFIESGRSQPSRRQRSGLRSLRLVERAAVAVQQFGDDGAVAGCGAKCCGFERRGLKRGG